MHHIPSKVCILGHIQRGGSPTPNDRFYASIMGHTAVKSIMEGKNQHAIVVRAGEVITVPLIECSEKSDHAMKDFIGIAESLSI